MAQVNRYAENPEAILNGCRMAQSGGKEIGELLARAIAGQWHSGQFSAMYAFSSTGHYDREALLAELSDCFDDVRNVMDMPLNMMGTYLLNRHE